MLDRCCSSSLQRKVLPAILKQDFAELSAILQKTLGELKQPFPLEAVPTAELSAGLAARRAPAAAPEPGQSPGPRGRRAAGWDRSFSAQSTSCSAHAWRGCQGSPARTAETFSQTHLDNLGFFYFIF